MKLIIWSPNDRSERGRGDSPSNSGPVKLVRRILGLKDPLHNGPGASAKPSMLDRLGEYFAHDLPVLYEVRPEDVETPSSSNQERAQARVVTELDSVTEHCSSTEFSPRSHVEIGQALQTAPADAKESPSMPPEVMAVHSIGLAAKEGIDQLQAAHQEMEASLKSLAQDCEKRQAELSSTIERISTTLQSAPQKITKELAGEVEKIAKDLLNRSAKQLREQAHATLVALGEQLTALRQGFIDETQKQLVDMTQASLESLTKAATEQARKQLSQMLDDFLAKGESRAQDSEKRQAELSSAIERISATLQSVQQKITRELRDEVEKGAKDLLDRSAKQLQGQADANVVALGEQITALRQGFIDETQKQLASMTQASLESLTKAATEQARKQLSQMLEEFLAKALQELEAKGRELLKKQGEPIQQQIDDFSKARLEEHRWEFGRVEHARKRRVGGLWAGLVGLGLVAMALIFVGIYASTSPIIRLRAKPPAGFFYERSDWSTKKQAREEQLARAYWECAVRDVQAKYGFGTNLPDEPPDEFKVEEKGVSGSGPKVDPVARARYWGKLREVWVLPDAWEKSSGWNTDGIRSAWQSAYSKAKQFASP